MIEFINNPPFWFNIIALVILPILIFGWFLNLYKIYKEFSNSNLDFFAFIHNNNLDFFVKMHKDSKISKKLLLRIIGYKIGLFGGFIGYL